MGVNQAIDLVLLIALRFAAHPVHPVNPVLTSSRAYFHLLGHDLALAQPLLRSVEKQRMSFAQNVRDALAKGALLKDGTQLFVLHRAGVLAGKPMVRLA